MSRVTLIGDGLAGVNGQRLVLITCESASDTVQYVLAAVEQRAARRQRQS